MGISVRTGVLIFTTILCLFTLILFFIPARYSNTDLSNAVQYYLSGTGNRNLLLGVRPLLIFLATLSPLPIPVTLSIISGIFYVFLIPTGFFLVKMLYGDRAAYCFPLLWLPNAYLMLNAFAPNADVPAIFAGLLIMWTTLKIISQKRSDYMSIVSVIPLGLLGGLLGLIRENVLTAVFGAFLLILFSDRLKGVIYLSIALSLPAIWQVYAHTAYGVSILTQISTGISLAIEYEYNPMKIARYFLYGVGPLTLFSLLLGLLYDYNRNRQKIIHCFLIPAVALALGWPAIFEPRLALIAFHALIPPASYGFSILTNSLANHVFYGKRAGALIIVTIYSLNLLFNVWMSYVNNKNSFSPIWRFLQP